MRLNTAPVRTVDRNREGSPVYPIKPAQQLRRMVLSALLWEQGSYYLNGADVSKAIAEILPQLDAQIVLDVAIEAREKQKLRHMPLFLLRELSRCKGIHVANTLARVIQRPDELGEFLAIYWKEKRQPLSAQVKKGLAMAFGKFTAYQLAKYNRDTAIKLRDVLFLCHAKPKDAEQAEVWKKLVDGSLESADTWELRQSAGTGQKSDEKKAENWTALLSENKLGALALLRNLRNMIQSGVDDALVRKAILGAKVERVLPFRFIAAAKYGPRFEPELEQAMFRCVESQAKLRGKTALVVDTSPSMWQANISEKSEMNRFEAAAALAILVRELCESVSIYAFNERAYAVPPRRGFGLRDALDKTKGNASCGGLALDMAAKDGYDRIIVLTDGQWHARDGSGYQMQNPLAICPEPAHSAPGYMVNMAATQNGVGYGKWTVIDGWSEAIIEYVQQEEELSASPLT